MKHKPFFYSFLIFICFLSFVFSLKDQVAESEETTTFLGSEGGSGDQKKLIVEVEPADYENDFIENLRDQEDVDRKFGMDDLGMIIEKVTKNRYYPYPPTMPISGSQFMLPNLIGSPYLGPYTLTNQQSQQSSPRFKEKMDPRMNINQGENLQSKEEEKFNQKREDPPQFKEQIVEFSEMTQKNATEEISDKRPTNNTTNIEKIEEKILKGKLEEALKKLNELNNNAKNLLEKKDTPEKTEESNEEKYDLNKTRPFH